MVAECLWSWAMMESEVRKEGLILDTKRDEEFSEIWEEDEKGRCKQQYVELGQKWSETHGLSLHKHMGAGPQAQKNTVLDPRGMKMDETS